MENFLDFVIKYWPIFACVGALHSGFVLWFVKLEVRLSKIETKASVAQEALAALSKETSETIGKLFSKLDEVSQGVARLEGHLGTINKGKTR